MVSINYTIHIEGIGWALGWAQNGIALGTVGIGKRAECVKFSFDNLPENTSIQYRAHVQDLGWLQWVSNNQEAGTTGRALRLEAIEFRFLSNPLNLRIFGRCHVQNIGWQELQGDNLTFGTTGQGLRIEAIQFWIIQPIENINVYNNHNAMNQLVPENLKPILNKLNLIKDVSTCVAGIGRTILRCATIELTGDATGCWDSAFYAGVNCNSIEQTGEEFFIQEFEQHQREIEANEHFRESIRNGQEWDSIDPVDKFGNIA